MEQNTTVKSQKIVLDNRKRLSMTGVKDVVAFEADRVILESVLGTVNIKGSGLKIASLSLDKGEADINGQIDGITYSEAGRHGEKGKSVIKRMFR